MKKSIKPVRVGLILSILFLILTIYCITLYDLQIINGEAYLAMSENSIVSTSTIEAARGSILDRNGRVLVSNRPISNVTINWAVLSTDENPNEIILRLAKAAIELGYGYTDSLPITDSPPFEFTEVIDNSKSGQYINAYIEYYSNYLDENPSASQIMAHMRRTYHIDPGYTAEEARIIVGIRFEIQLRSLIENLYPYVFAEDVDTDLIAVIGEQVFPGIVITESSARQYHTVYAAHILGHIGLMTEEEYDTYKTDGYPMNAYVGKYGIEKAHESYLHGINGTKKVTYNASGSVIDAVTTVIAEPGDNVVLSIDIDLQAAAENSLVSTIEKINSERSADEDQADAGAAVVIDVNSGEVLASASYPAYRLETYSQDYELLVSDSDHPLNNRATSGLYQPGSTFKMITALAALSTGQISPYTTFTCTGSYSIGDYTYKCLGTHGTINLSTAIEKSCNVYFYNIAYNMDINILAKCAESFGFGSATGLEISEAAGVIASPEYEEYLYELYEDEYYAHWYTGQTLHAAIGQSYHQFTPIQIANYIATIANNGLCYRPHFLKEVRDRFTGEAIYIEQPEIQGTVDVSGEYFSVIQQAMLSVTLSGSASSVLSNYDIQVASKTGTSQTNSEIDDGIFVCFAPANDPQIAIAVVIEKGGSGKNSSMVAKDILDRYFKSNVVTDDIITENTLLQ